MATLLSYGHTDYKDGYGMTALHHACQQTDATFVQLLLEHDLNVDEQDVFQRSPLASAAWRNNAFGVVYLLDRAANKEVRDTFGPTPLLQAIQYAAVDAARVLLERIYDVLAVDHESQTLLHRAALSRDITNIEFLGKDTRCVLSISTQEITRPEQLKRGFEQSNLRRAPQNVHSYDRSRRKRQANCNLQTKAALSRHTENDQDVFKDAIEYQSEDSPTSSCHTTDNENLSARARRKGKARLPKPPKQMSRNWASKYRNNFRSLDRHRCRVYRGTDHCKAEWVIDGDRLQEECIVIRTQLIRKADDGRYNGYDHHNNGTDNLFVGTTKMRDSLM